MTIKRAASWCLGLSFYLLTLLIISSFSASHVNKAASPQDWPTRSDNPLVGVWQGAWGGEVAVMYKQSIDMKLAVYSSGEAFLSLAPHPARNELPSTIKVDSALLAEGIELEDGSGGRYKFVLEGGALLGTYQSANNEIGHITLRRILDAEGVGSVEGDRGDTLLEVGPIVIDEFGTYLIFVAFWDAFFQTTVYFTTCGLCIFFLYRVMRKRWQWRKIQRKWPTWQRYRNELWMSLTTLILFGISGSLLLYCSYADISQMYSYIGIYGWGYWCFSVIAVFLLHDTYFYWGHRFMHIRPLYPLFHKGHHRSLQPNPWSSFSFMPLEAILQGAFVPLIIFVLPLHYSVIVIFYAGMFLRTLIGHTGFEIYPRFIVRSKHFRWIATVTHHDMHHSDFTCNYALYFTFWDRLMRTLHPDYEKRFDQIFERERKIGGATGAQQVLDNKGVMEN